MSGLGRITQEVVEVLAPDQGAGRITQELVEVVGSVPSTARVTQLYVEALVSTKLIPKQSRITMLYAEPIGPPDVSARISQLVGEAIGPPGAPARITQLLLEIIGPQTIEACTLPNAFFFSGDVSGLFYIKRKMGAESVPIALADSRVLISEDESGRVGQSLTQDDGWINWNPDGGGLLVQFANGKPVRTLWVITNLARGNPPSIPVWASSRKFDLWKQVCIP